MLRTTLSTRTAFSDEDAERPSRFWDAFVLKDPAVVRPCSLCAARRGARIPALVRIRRDALPVCVQHRRTLVSFRDELLRARRSTTVLPPAVELSLDATPEILEAIHRYRILRRRRRSTVEAAFAAATHLTTSRSSWPRRRHEQDPIVERWRERGRLLPGIGGQVTRFQRPSR
ncbi:hypothetical protein [Catenuloplanes japonicus]|uniref:hypothetical protein n=1 Tax=Catenuloplanes japonicus TaxID=33876 RepID=UPI000526F38A|nr:hypothetical protein [Catenuloplanes japonicus]